MRGWVAIPDNLDEDPRIIRSGGIGAIGILARLYAYSGRNETDGKVPLQFARSGVGLPRLRKLVEAGLLRLEDSFVVVDEFLEFNVPHEHREAQRKTDRERKQLTSARNPLGVARESETTPCVQDRTAQDRTASWARVRGAKSDTDTRRSHLVEGPDLDRVRGAFTCAFLRATGVNPTWGPKQSNLLDRLLSAHDAAEIERRIDRCFDDREPKFAWRDGTVDFARFVALFDQIPSPQPKDATPELWSPEPVVERSGESAI